MLNHFQNKFLPEAGRLLISEPFLQDANFRRTVVLLTEHDEQNSIGFILNRVLPVELKEVLEFDINQSVPLHLGGPVQHNTLHYLHRDENLADSSRIIGDNLYWGGDFDYIAEKLQEGTLDSSLYRFFLGYSGWGTGQLESEIAENTWIVGSCISSMVFDMDEQAMWKHILSDMGGDFKRMTQFPESPLLN
jgi:putative transcriptional regulator